MHSRASKLATTVVLVLACFGTSASGALALPPTIDGEWITGITFTNATLNAEINPNGLLTKYKLQIDTTGDFHFAQNDSCVLHPPGIVCAQVIINGPPLPPGLVEPPESSLAASFVDQHVSVNMASIGATLQPGTTYHYRAIAANSLQVVGGPDQTFTTPPVSPLIGLTANIDEGEGTVVSSQPGIECGATCKAEFKEGSKVTLTASPATGYAFRGWRKCDTGGTNGRQCTVTISSAKEVGHPRQAADWAKSRLSLTACSAPTLVQAQKLRSRKPVSRSARNRLSTATLSGGWATVKARQKVASSV